VKYRVRRVALAAVLAALVGSAACATSINSVLADPSRYRNREVKISGRVADSYSVADRGFYRLQDRSGQLWVVSDRGVPRTGARVSVKGRIRDAFNLGVAGRRLPPGIASGLILIETSHSAQ
jgi:hypothetical protein